MRGAGACAAGAAVPAERAAALRGSASMRATADGQRPMRLRLQNVSTIMSSALRPDHRARQKASNRTTAKRPDTIDPDARIRRSDAEIADPVVAAPRLDPARQRHAAGQENADALLDRDVRETTPCRADR